MISDDVEELVSLFTEDGSLEAVSPPSSGIDTSAAQGHEWLRQMYHQSVGLGLLPCVHNHVVELDGDRATGFCSLEMRCVLVFEYLSMRVIVFVLVTTLLAGCVTQPDRQPLRLYVMDCGYVEFNSLSFFGYADDETDVREMFVPCYLVDHPQGQLFWDAALDLGLVGQGKLQPQVGVHLSYERSVLDQLREIGVAESDVEWIAFSHMHADHTGAANHFPDSHLLIQKAEYEAAFEWGEGAPMFDSKYYDELKDNPKTILAGDHDVFGDGRVVIMSAPGHTPGHQVLYLDLAQTGPIVLSGDLYHFRFNRTHRRTSENTKDPVQTMKSRQKVEAFLKEKGAAIWIGHDKALADTLNKSPAYYQ